MDLLLVSYLQLLYVFLICQDQTKELLISSTISLLTFFTIGYITMYKHNMKLQGYIISKYV